MAIVDDPTLCAILVIPQYLGGTVKVGDFANLIPQTGRRPVGYAELNDQRQDLRCSHVMIVKRGQNAVIMGFPKIRLFVRVPLGTTKEVAKFIADDVWAHRKTVTTCEPPRWHEYFTKK